MQAIILQIFLQMNYSNLYFLKTSIEFLARSLQEMPKSLVLFPSETFANFHSLNLCGFGSELYPT